MWRGGLPPLGREAPLKPITAILNLESSDWFYDCFAVERGQAPSPHKPAPTGAAFYKENTFMRIGLVGYGHGGRFFHAPLISSLPAATFVGVVTRSAERRQLLAAEHPGVPAFDSIGQLVEAGVDVLVISTPLKGRPALVLDAIEHEVAVVSDKPFAADAQQAQTLITMAERQGVQLSVYQNRRWDSDFLTVRKLCLLYTSPSPRDRQKSRMPSSA